MAFESDDPVAYNWSGYVKLRFLAKLRHLLKIQANRTQQKFPHSEKAIGMRELPTSDGFRGIVPIMSPESILANIRSAMGSLAMQNNPLPLWSIGLSLRSDRPNEYFAVGQPYVFLSRGISFTALSRSTNFRSASLNIFNSRIAWACSNMLPPGGKSVPNRILSGVTS